MRDIRISALEVVEISQCSALDSFFMFLFDGYSVLFKECIECVSLNANK